MSSENPYAAPPPIIEDVPVAQFADALPIASTNRRFCNLFLDQLIMAALAYGTAFTVGVVIVLMSENPQVELSPEDEKSLNALGYPIGYAVSVMYYIFFEALFRRTPAKFVTSTRVVNADGGEPTFGQIVGRSFARLIPFDAFSFFGDFPIGWHDSLSGTRVIGPPHKKPLKGK